MRNLNFIKNKNGKPSVFRIATVFIVVLALVFTTVQVRRAFAAVAFDAITESSVFSTTPDPFTFDHTPVGTPRGVLVFIWRAGDGALAIQGVTYGGETMTQVGLARDSTTEIGSIWAFFLGTGVPTGTQTVSIDHQSGSNKIAWAITLTAAGDTEIVDSDILEEDAADPQIALTSVGTALRFAGLYSGHDDPASHTPITGMTELHDHDGGAKTGSMIMEDTPSSGTTTVGWTATSEDMAMVALAVGEVAEDVISGTCKQSDQSTDCSDTGGNSIKVAVNGVLQAQTDTTVDGSWSISGVSAIADDIITIFIEGETASSSQAVAVTKYSGSGDIGSIELIEGSLSIGSDQNNTITNADLAQYDNSVSGNSTFHDVDANNDLTVDADTAMTGEKLYVKSSNTYRPDSASSGNVTTQHLDNNGTITADGNTFTLSGDWDNSGTFTANTSTVVFSTTSTSNISGTTTFNNFTATTAGKILQFNDGETQTISGTFTVTGADANQIQIHSDTLGAKWYINLTGSAAVTYALIYDSGCAVTSGNISLNSTNTNSGNNGSCWMFTAETTQTKIKGNIRIKGGTKF